MKLLLLPLLPALLIALLLAAAAAQVPAAGYGAYNLEVAEEAKRRRMAHARARARRRHARAAEGGLSLVLMASCLLPSVV